MQAAAATERRDLVLQNATLLGPVRYTAARYADLESSSRDLHPADVGRVRRAIESNCAHAAGRGEHAGVVRGCKRSCAKRWICRDQVACAVRVIGDSRNRLVVAAC